MKEMVKEGKKSASVKKGKRPHKNKLTSKKYLKYKGNVNAKANYCPRCGPGIFMAVNKGRLHCGRCHYTEFTNTS